MNNHSQNVVPFRTSEAAQPSPAEVLEQLDRLIERTPPAGRIPLVLAVATRLSELAARILEGAERVAPTPERVERLGPTTLITVEQAARIAGVSKRWVYDHTKGLRFRHDLSRKRVRIDEVGFRRWLQSRRT